MTTLDTLAFSGIGSTSAVALAFGTGGLAGKTGAMFFMVAIGGQAGAVPVAMNVNDGSWTIVQSNSAGPFNFAYGYKLDTVPGTENIGIDFGGDPTKVYLMSGMYGVVTAPSGYGFHPYGAVAHAGTILEVGFVAENGSSTFFDTASATYPVDLGDVGNQSGVVGHGSWVRRHVSANPAPDPGVPSSLTGPGIIFIAADTSTAKGWSLGIVK